MYLCRECRENYYLNHIMNKKSCFLSNAIKALAAVSCAIFALTACGDDDDNTSNGDYAVTTYRLSSASSDGATAVSSSIKMIDLTLSNGSGITLNLTLGSRNWTPAVGTYTYSSSVSSSGEFTGNLVFNGSEIDLNEESKLTISLSGSTYDIIAIAVVDSKNKARMTYSGSIDFGTDEVATASGYTLDLSTSTVSVTDYTTYQTTYYDNVTKYTINIYDAEGTQVAAFDAINSNGLDLDDLMGGYTLQSYPTEKWLMDVGWVYYGNTGGSYYTDASGTKQYITDGTVVLTSAEDADGVTYYSFYSAGNVSTTDANSNTSTGYFSYDYVAVQETIGTSLRDQTITSTVLGQTMKYSVYLPESYDGSKTYPVLYLFHGYDGDNNNWLDGGKIGYYAGKAASEGTAPEMIIIMPDGMNAFYINGYQNNMQYMTYFFDEFVPYIEKTYKIKAERASRAIGGLSMGGYGSLYYGVLHSEMFCYVYACSPLTYMDGIPDLYDMYGEAVDNGDTLPGITIEIGTEDFLYSAAVTFEAFLTSEGIEHEYITRSGTHDWAFWLACSPHIMAKLGEVFE